MAVLPFLSEGGLWTLKLTFSWVSRDQMPFFPDAAAATAEEEAAVEADAAPPRGTLRPASANDVIAPEVKEFKMELR